MRKLVLLLGVMLILALVVIYYPAVAEKPVKDGQGSLAVWIDPRYPAPEYHSPLDWWQAHHKDIVNQGDLMQEDCLHCHEPARSCNNCHDYVGVQQIITPAAP